jgi:hypothetical protein
MAGLLFYPVFRPQRASRYTRLRHRAGGVVLAETDSTSPATLDGTEGKKRRTRLSAALRMPYPQGERISRVGALAVYTSSPRPTTTDLAHILCIFVRARAHSTSEPGGTAFTSHRTTLLWDRRVPISGAGVRLISFLSPPHRFRAVYPVLFLRAPPNLRGHTGPATAGGG